jgi:hypothetical protein
MQGNFLLLLRWFQGEVEDEKSHGGVCGFGDLESRDLIRSSGEFQSILLTFARPRIVAPLKYFDIPVIFDSST